MEPQSRQSGAVAERLKAADFTIGCPMLAHRAGGPNPPCSASFDGGRDMRHGIAIQAYFRGPVKHCRGPR